jgi:hypothetical protein
MAGDIRVLDVLMNLAGEKDANLRYPQRELIWLVVLGVTLLAHASYINNGFTWLDHIDIEHHSGIRLSQRAMGRPVSIGLW